MGSFPYKLLVKSVISEGVQSTCNHSLEISSISVFHYNTQWLNILDIEGCFIGNDVGHANRSKESDFIESCAFLFLFCICKKHAFHGIVFLVWFSFYQLNTTVAACAQVSEDLEVFQTYLLLYFVHRRNYNQIYFWINGSKSVLSQL